MLRRSDLAHASLLLLLATTLSAQTLSLKVAGTSRSALLYAPSGLSSPALVFVLHGLGGDGAGMRSSTQMDKVADREKFVVAYPNAVGGTWDYAGAKNDYAFLQAVIDSAVARHGVDRNRVYVSGFSQGGGMAVYAGFTHPETYAAIAPVSSVGSGAPTPKRPIPILLTFGTKDLYSPATFMQSVASWLKFDSCPATPTVVRPYPATSSKSMVTRLSYGNCAQGTEIVVDSIQGGGHEWPNNTSTKINNAEEVWAFFKRFTLNRGTTSIRRSDGTSRPLVVAGVSGGLRLEGLENVHVRICDLRGRVLASGPVVEGRFTWTAPAAGLYLARLSDGRSAHVAVP